MAGLIAVGVVGCAEEPPPERYTEAIQAETEKERLSLKDIWDNGTTVQRAAPATSPTYMPSPRAKPKPAPKRAVRAVEPPAVPARPEPKSAPPDLAISAPPRAVPKAPPAVPPAASPAVPPKALTERDLQQDTFRCGVGVDCLAVLRAMISDPQQSWMMRAPTPAEFANGTRLFAYRALRQTLDCGRLRFAGAELEWALDTFSRDVEGLDSAHRARVAALAAEVRAELDAEVRKRC